jgi:ribulose 1,5-bisphosphate carboxylase large subunit-like protein
VTDPAAGCLRARFLLSPPSAADALLAEVTHGQRTGPERVAGRVVDVDGGVVTIELPAANWSADLTMRSRVVVGEIVETAAFERCRLIGLDLPAGWLPGPAHDPAPEVVVGAIVKPSLGLGPEEVAAVAEQLAGGGARLVKDDELLGDPAWCPLEARVRAVARRLPPGVTYAANVSGSYDGLFDRARRAVEAGAGALMVNAGAQGLDAVRALREGGLGVPILAHRVGTGALTRNEAFGMTLGVLAQLTRLAGADYVLCGAFGGKLHDRDEDVADEVAACHRSLPGRPRRSTALLGGGVGPGNVAELLRRARDGTRRGEGTGGQPGGEGARWERGGIVLLLGQAAYRHPGGVSGGVRATVRAVAEAVAA